MMTLRNIFIVGAAKAGTTALYYLLIQHPEICFPVVKEPNFFNNGNSKRDVVKPGTGPGDANTTWTDSLSAYHNLYDCDKNEHRFRLDASVSYLYSTEAARRISAYSPEARIIIVLRNPADRAWSHYKHLIRDGRERLSFEEALASEEERIRKGWEFSWHLTQMGHYSQQIQRYLDCFDRHQIQIFLFEDIKQDMGQVIKKTADFTLLPDFDYNLEQTRHNVSGISKSRVLAGAVNWITGYKSIINKVIPPKVTHHLMQRFHSLNTKRGGLSLSEETRQKLISCFEDDVQKTEQLIGRDLSGWLK